MIEFFGRGGALKPTWYGDCLPSRDFPMLIDLYLQGRLDLDGFVSETIPLDERRGGLPPDGAGRGPPLRRRPRPADRLSASPARSGSQADAGIRRRRRRPGTGCGTCDAGASAPGWRKRRRAGGARCRAAVRTHVRSSAELTRPSCTLACTPRPSSRAAEPPGRPCGSGQENCPDATPSRSTCSRRCCHWRSRSLADALQRRASQRLAPTVDPEQPARVRRRRRVEAEHPVELVDGPCPARPSSASRRARSVAAAYSKASASRWSFDSKW